MKDIYALAFVERPDRHRKRDRQTERERENMRGGGGGEKEREREMRENSNSKTVFYKDFSLGSVKKKLSNN